MVGRPDELVTREDLAIALWGSNTFVDSEHSINSAIRKLRSALGDDPARPEYIETVVRRGYRFLAEVHVSGEVGSAANISAPNIRPWILRPATFMAAALLLTVAVAADIVETNGIWSSPPSLSWNPITKTIHPETRIASDGIRVFWTECPEAKCTPWQVPVNGDAEASPVRIPFPDAFLMDASRGGLLLLAVPTGQGKVGIRAHEGSLWEFDSFSGQAHRLGEIVTGDAAWSPGAKRIAFTRGKQLWLADRDGMRPRMLATVQGPIIHLHWSPDGGVVRFVIQPNTEWRYPLWEADVVTGRTRPLLPQWTAGSVLGGAWRPRGDYIFGGERDGRANLWQLTAPSWTSSGYGLRQLTQGPLNFSGPVAIPGSTDLAVVGSNKRGELARFDSTAQRFVPFMNGISAQMTDFSRDGKWVVYVTYPERDLWRSRIDGTGAVQLTHHPLLAALPRISPDGRQIAFTGDYAGKEMRTWLLPFNGGEPKPASKFQEGTAQVAPTWSADGTKLLYRFDRAVMANVLQILDVYSGSVETVPESGDKFNQRWSPDGKWLAATGNDENGLEVFDVNRRKWTLLTGMRADYPNWSRNSQFIYFSTRVEDGEAAIYRVSLASHKPERVASLTGTPRAFDQTFNQWAGLSPDDSPLVVRSADLQQIFRLSIAR